jgi:hypothetical protein
MKPPKIIFIYLFIHGFPKINTTHKLCQNYITVTVSGPAADSNGGWWTYRVPNIGLSHECELIWIISCSSKICEI